MCKAGNRDVQQIIGENPRRFCKQMKRIVFSVLGAYCARPQNTNEEDGSAMIRAPLPP
jgi:hypothetical protein